MRAAATRPVDDATDEMVAVRRPKRRVGGVTLGVGLLVIVGGLVLAAIASIAVGAKTMPWSDAWNALAHYDNGLENHLIVRELRVPRTVLAVMVGAALGLAGAVMQGVTRNPLADPGLLGVNSGAALFVVMGISQFGVSTTSGLVWFAMAGAAAAGAFVYVLGATGRGGATPVKLAIAGAAMSALMGSFTSALLLLDSATLNVFRFWAVGSVAGRDLGVAQAVAPFIVVGILFALFSGRALNGIALGEDVARSLGQRVGYVQAVAALSVVLLCGGATAAAGPIWFLGLTVPHVVRSITGPDHRWLLPYSMLVGAAFLTVADVIGRVIVRPGELEVGIVTAVVGAPIFISFVRRRRIAEL